MANDPLEFTNAALARLTAKGLRRSLRSLANGHDPWIELNGRRVLHLASNSYLGLATDPRVINAAVEATKRYGAGSGASQLVTGHFALHAELEQAIAQLKHQAAALVFASGYAANVGALTALAGPRDVIIADALNHASLIDGCRQSRARTHYYRHADVSHARALFETASRDRHFARARKLLVTDGVFSMDGDVAPLRELADLADDYGAILIVDDAHGTGVLGPTGGGAAEAAGVSDRVHVHIGTLSKALGSQGGFVAGPQRLIDFLVNTSRAFIFSTALAPAQVGAAIEALRIVRDEPQRRERAIDLAARFALGAGATSALPAPTTPIVPVVIGSAAEAVAFAGALLERNVLAPAIRPPAVPEGSSRIRVSWMATHTDDDLAHAITAFGAACKPRW